MKRFGVFAGLLGRCACGFRRVYGGPWYRRIVVWGLTVVLSVVLLLGAVDCNFLYLFGRSPGFADIKNPVVSEASEIYSADGKLIGRYYNENRTPVEYADLSPLLVHTLIDTEDERFYQHRGIDFKGLFAAAKDMLQGRARGASTITSSWPRTCSVCVPAIPQACWDAFPA